MIYWNNIYEFNIKEKYTELHIDLKDFTIIGSEVSYKYNKEVEPIIEKIKDDTRYSILESEVLDKFKELEKRYKDFIYYNEVIINNKPVRYLHLYKYNNRFIIFDNDNPILYKDLFKEI